MITRPEPFITRYPAPLDRKGLEQPMPLDKATVARIATLARIRLAEDELEPMAAALSGILDWVEQLKEVDTENVAPMASVAEVSLPVRNDIVTDGGRREAILGNAPRSEKGFFTVPKVVE